MVELENIVKKLRQKETGDIIRKTIRIIYFPDKLIFKLKKFDLKDTIAIVGTPRSGTTWLMEVFAKIPNYTYYFEPINPIWFPQIRGLGFQSRTYLPPGIDWLEGEDYFKKAFTGRVFSLNPPIKSKPDAIMQRMIGKKLIIKFVRANRLLPWMADKFQLRGIFFIIRHPCAVVASQLKTGFYAYFSDSEPYHQIKPTLQDVLNEALKIDILDKKIITKMKQYKTEEEILTAIWCLDNYVPLNCPKSHPWTTIAYEKLVKDENEVVRLFNILGEKNIPKSVIKDIKEPSMLTLGRDKDMILKADKQLSKWKKDLSEQQIERILNVVKDFGLDFYNENIEPDYERIGD
jgi:hypothetical protein